MSTHGTLALVVAGAAVVRSNSGASWKPQRWQTNQTAAAEDMALAGRVSATCRLTLPPLLSSSSGRSIAVAGAACAQRNANSRPRIQRRPG